MKRLFLVFFALFLGACSTGSQDPHAGHDMSVMAMESPTPDPHAGHDMSAMESPDVGAVPEGYAEVEIAPDRQQLIGLKTARAERATLAGTLRASAIVQTDETREAHVHSRLMGWVRELYVSSVGQTVKTGQPLYSLYSQELYAAQQEYLRARQTSPELAAAARSRLRLWNVPEDQIEKMEASGPQETVLFRSPISGTVIEKEVLAGHYLEPEMMLYRIADLSRVWIIAEIYEYEVDRLDREGECLVRVQGIAEPVRATIDYVYPTVDPVSRTVKVRLLAQNADGRLRPGSFATAELPTRPIDAVWVPEAALVDTGVRQVVYLALEGGRFRPVAVKAGRRVEGRIEITEGLPEGALVVTGAQFLLDSESQMRGAGRAPGHGGH